MDALIQYLEKYNMKTLPALQENRFEQFHRFEYKKGYSTYHITIRKYLGVCFVQTDISFFADFSRAKKRLFMEGLIEEAEQLAKSWNCKSIAYTTYQRGDDTEIHKKFFSSLLKYHYHSVKSPIYLMDTTCNLLYKDLEEGHWQRLENIIQPFSDAIELAFKQDITAVVKDLTIIDRFPQSKISLNLIYFGSDHSIYLDFYHDQFCIKHTSIDSVMDVTIENVNMKAKEVYTSMLNAHRLKNIFDPSIYHFRSFFKTHISASDSFLAFSLQRIKKFLQINEEQLEQKMTREYDLLIAEVKDTHFFQGEVEIMNLFGIRFLFHRQSAGSRLYICVNETEFQESFEKIKTAVIDSELKKINAIFSDTLTNYENKKEKNL
jgi:hypothetical protein